MTVQIGRIPPDDRHLPRSRPADQRGRFIWLGRAYGEYLHDYALELTADAVVAGEIVANALTAATAHFEHADFGQVRADRARAERIRGRRPDLSRIGSWSEQAQIWAEQARADADPAGRSAPGRKAAESIRPWLYATVRRECMTRIRAAGGGRPAAPSGRHAAELPTPGSARPAGSGAWSDETVADALTSEFEVTDLQAEELRAQVMVVTQVLSGLPHEAREILGLAIRHGLGDDDIAVVMGMSRRRAGQERAEAAARFGRSAVTVLLLHAGWSGCERLDKMLGGSYPTAEPPSDKLCVKVTKHSENCMICGRIVASRGFGPELLSVLGITRLPRPVRQQLGRVAREMSRTQDTPPATAPDREQSRRRGRGSPPGRPAACAGGAASSGATGAGRTGAGRTGAEATAASAAAAGASAAASKVADADPAAESPDSATGEGAARAGQQQAGEIPASPSAASPEPGSEARGSEARGSATQQRGGTQQGANADSTTPDTPVSDSTISDNAESDKASSGGAGSGGAGAAGGSGNGGPGGADNAASAEKRQPDRVAAASAGPGGRVPDRPVTVTMVAQNGLAGSGATARKSTGRLAAKTAGDAPGAGKAGAAAGNVAPPWEIMPAGRGLLDGPDRADVVTIGEEPDRADGSWLTRPRAAVVSALAILVIVAGIVLAGKIAAAPPSHRPDSRPSPAAASTPSPAASGTAPSAVQQASKQARTHAVARHTTSAPPVILPSSQPGTTPPSSHSSAPSKPKPTPSKSTKPSPTPTTSSPSPDPSPTTTSTTPTP